MKFQISLSNSAKLRSIVWSTFPIIALLPLAAPFYIERLENMVRSNKAQIIFSVMVYILPLIWAYINSLRAKQKFRTEYSLLKRVSDTANEQRRSLIQDNGKQVLDITRSEREPDYYLGGEGGGSGNETIASLMVQQLCKNAEEMRRDSDLTSQVFIRSLFPLKSAVQIPQQVALRIGILFTFAGLLIGLEPVANMFQGTADTRQAIGELISGLTIAFGTSISGLMAALMIQILVNLVDHEYGRTSQQLESAWMDLGHVLSFVRLEGDLPANVDRLSEEINNHREDVNIHTRNLIEQVDRILTDNEKQRESVSYMQQTVSENESLIRKLVNAHEEHLTEFRSFLQEFRQLDSRLSNSLSKVVNDSEIRGQERNELLSGELKSSIEKFDESIRKHLQSLQTTFIEKLPGLLQQELSAKDLNTSVEKLNEQLSLQHNEQLTLMTKLGEEVNVPIDNSQLNETLSLLNQNMNELRTFLQNHDNKKSTKFSKVISVFIGGSFACIALFLALALIGQPVQDTLDKIHRYLVTDNQETEH